jgi:hypothetical protein
MTRAKARRSEERAGPPSRREGYRKRWRAGTDIRTLETDGPGLLASCLSSRAFVRDPTDVDASSQLGLAFVQEVRPCAQAGRAEEGASALELLTPGRPYSYGGPRTVRNRAVGTSLGSEGRAALRRLNRAPVEVFAHEGRFPASSLLRAGASRSRTLGGAARPNAPPLSTLRRSSRVSVAPCGLAMPLERNVALHL